jgi:hypothetical protein
LKHKEESEKEILVKTFDSVSIKEGSENPTTFKINTSYYDCKKK